MLQHRINELGDHITAMDRASQIGLARIGALASLLQVAMQAPGARLVGEEFIQVLANIEEIAESTMDTINVEAERAGNFHFKDVFVETRQKASHRVAQQVSKQEARP